MAQVLALADGDATVYGMPDDISIEVNGVCMYAQVHVGQGKNGANVLVIWAIGELGDMNEKARQYMSAQGAKADIIDVAADGVI